MNPQKKYLMYTWCLRAAALAGVAFIVVFAYWAQWSWRGNEILVNHIDGENISRLWDLVGFPLGAGILLVALAGFTRGQVVMRISNNSISPYYAAKFCLLAVPTFFLALFACSLESLKADLSFLPIVAFGCAVVYEFFDDDNEILDSRFLPWLGLGIWTLVVGFKHGFLGALFYGLSPTASATAGIMLIKGISFMLKTSLVIKAEKLKDSRTPTAEIKEMNG